MAHQPAPRAPSPHTPHTAVFLLYQQPNQEPLQVRVVWQARLAGLQGSTVLQRMAANVRLHWRPQLSVKLSHAASTACRCPTRLAASPARWAGLAWLQKEDEWWAGGQPCCTCLVSSTSVSHGLNPDALPASGLPPAQRGKFNTRSFAKAHNLGDPVAVTWFNSHK